MPAVLPALHADLDGQLVSDVRTFAGDVADRELMAHAGRAFAADAQRGFARRDADFRAIQRLWFVAGTRACLALPRLKRRVKNPSSDSFSWPIAEAAPMTQPAVINTERSIGPASRDAPKIVFVFLMAAFRSRL